MSERSKRGQTASQAHANNRNRPSRRAKFLRAIAILIAFSLLTIILEATGWLRGAETRALDTLLVLKQRHSSSSPSLLTIVGISEQDYQAVFNARSPLDAEGLQKLIEAIAAARPAVICVDIETADDSFKKVALPQGTTLVWARDTTPSPSGREVLQPVLGGRDTDAPVSGIAQLPLEEDGAVRYYKRKSGEWDTLNWAVTKAYCRQLVPGGANVTANLQQRCAEILKADEGHEGEYLLHLTGGEANFEHASALEVLTTFFESDKRVQEKLTGRIVLLGGEYKAARDSYPTPLGSMSGVSLTAQAIEAELRGLGLERPREGVILLVNLLLGILMMVLFITQGPWRGLLMGLSLVVVIALVWSLVAFDSIVYLLFFVPVLVGMLIQHTYENFHSFVHGTLHDVLSRSHPQVNVAPPAAEKSPARTNTSVKQTKKAKRRKTKKGR